MSINFDDLTDQQCVDIISHFVKRKNTPEIIIHTETYNIIVKKEEKTEDVIPDAFAACFIM